MCRAHFWMKRNIQFFIRLTSASMMPWPSATGVTWNMLSHSSLRMPALAAWYEKAYGGISPIAVPAPQSSAGGITCTFQSSELLLPADTLHRSLVINSRKAFASVLPAWFPLPGLGNLSLGHALPRIPQANTKDVHGEWLGVHLEDDVVEVYNAPGA